MLGMHASVLTIARVAVLAALGGVLTVPAHAQDVEEGVDSGEILVTARKRTETLTSVPASIAVLTPDAIETKGIVSTADLIGRMPGLSTSTDINSPGRDFLSLVIRGIGANAGGGDPAAPIFVDGIYQPRLGFDTRYVDVERVEVLKGPQGALFGRNTEAGAVSILFRRPGPQTQVKLFAEADAFESFRSQASVSGAVAEGLYAGASFDVATTDGYLRNAVIPGLSGNSGTISADRSTSYQGRVSVVAKPTDRLEIYLAADAQKWKGQTGLPGVPRGCDCYRVNSDFQQEGVSSNWGVALNMTWHGAGVDVTSLSGYRKLDSALPFDFDGGADRGPNTHDYRNYQEFYSTELRVSSNDSAAPLQWVGGLYAFRDGVKSRRSYDLQDFDDMGIGIPTTGLTIDYQNVDLDKKGIAAFGQLSWSPTSRLELTIGGRYGREKIDGNFAALATIHPYEIVIGGVGRREASFNNFTGSGSIKYSFPDVGIVYATVSQGARSGGLPLTPASADSFVPYKSEKALSYEIGFKSRLAGGRAHVTAALFHIDLRDQQLTSIVVDGGIAIATTGNAGKAHSQGFELSADAEITRGLTVSGAVGYTDARFDDYVDGANVQHAGERLRFVPRWTGSMGAAYTTEVGSGGSKVQMNLDARHVGGQTQGYGVIFDPHFAIKGYDIVDASIAFIRPDWRVQIFADNLFDNYVEMRVFNTFYFVPDGTRAFSSVMPPRRIGARYTLNF
jgi:iron complex outermembrane receptor protein